MGISSLDRDLKTTMLAPEKGHTACMKRNLVQSSLDSQLLYICPRAKSPKNQALHLSRKQICTKPKSRPFPLPQQPAGCCERSAVSISGCQICHTPLKTGI